MAKEKVGKKKRTKESPMDRLSAGYEKFIEGKETNANGGELFEKTLKKAAKPHAPK